MHKTECFSFKHIDGYKKGTTYKPGDIVYVYGNKYKISSIHRGDFCGDLIEKGESYISKVKRGLFRIFKEGGKETAIKEAREKAEAERIAREKAEAERIAREKAEAERIAREKAEAEAKEQADKEARKKAIKTRKQEREEKYKNLPTEKEIRQLYVILIKKFHPDTSGTNIIHEILGRDLTDKEKNFLENELNELKKVNLKISQKINNNKNNLYSLRNLYDTQDFLNTEQINKLREKLEKIKSNEK